MSSSKQINCFYKGSESKYFMFCGSDVLCYNYLTLPYSIKASIDNKQGKRWAFVPVELYSQRQVMHRIWPMGYSWATPN